MMDENKTKEQLIEELHEMRKHLADMERSAEALEKRVAALTRPPEGVDRIAYEDRFEASLRLAQFSFGNASIGIYQVAMDGRIIHVNPYAAKMLGYTTEELTALSIFDLDPFVNADTMNADIEKLAVGDGDSFETVHLKKDGSKIPVEVTSNLLQYEDQQYAISFVREIGDRKKMEEKLRRNERMLRRIIDIVPSMIFVKNAEGRFLMVNKATADLLSMTVDELVGRLHQDVHPDPDQVARMLADDRKVIESGETVFIVEQPYRDGSGVTRWLQTIKIPCDEDDFGEPAIVGLAVDITEHKQMEQALRDSEERLRDLVRNVPGVVYQYKANPALDDIGKVVTIVQDKCMEIFGIDPEVDNFHEAFTVCLPEKDRFRFEQSIMAAGKAEKDWHYEGRFTKPSGETIWFEGNSVPRRVGDELVYYGVLTDITYRKEMESSLRLARYIMEKADIGIFILGENGEFLDVNEEACRYLGYSREELGNMDVFDVDTLFTPEGWAAHMADLRSHGVKTLETLNRHKNGTVFPVQVIDNIMTFEDREFHVAFVQDITERKQAEAALRENEQLLSNILESMNEGVIVLDRDFRYQIFNTAIENITNTPKQAVLGKKPWDVFDFIRGSVVEENMRNTMRGKTQGTMEVQLSLPHKPDAWFRESFTPLEDSDGRIIGVIEVISDITRQKQDEEELHSLIDQLRESEARFKALHNASFGGITIHDKGRILECNQGLSEITGYSVDELIGMNGMLLIAEKYRKMVMDKIVSGYEKPYEAFGLHKNGKEYPIRLEARNIPYKGKRVRTVEFRDITEQKKAEAELRHLKNYLSNIIDSMPSALVVVDHDGRVTQWNRQAQQTTGLDLEKVRSQPLAVVFPYLAKEMHQIETAIRERRVISIPKVPRKTESKTRYEAITIFPLLATGVEGAVIRVDDISEQVRLEEMMIQSEKMLFVGGLAAGMAHEINNPLAGMLQTAEVMAKRLGGSFHIPASQKAAETAGTTLEAIYEFMETRGILRMIDSIKASGLRVSSIVDNMLSFARKSEATVSSHDLGMLLDKTAELATTDYDLKKQYDFKQIEIRREYAADVPFVPCEGAKIQQVLLNILRNGAQAMQAAGTLSPTFILRTRFDPKQNMAVMEIEDNGPGMDEQTRRRVFEPFFTTKPVGSGTGLGLSVSYFIITENHNGEMAVESRPGAGARFIVRLPIKSHYNAGGDI